MKKLERNEMKYLFGGDAPAQGGCHIVYSSQGYSSCWYTSGDPNDLCHRVYGDNCEANTGTPVNCAENNCTMN